MTKKGRGRPRADIPFVEFDGDYIRYRRKVPEDLRVVLGEWFVHRFEKDATEEHIRTMAAALTTHHDQMVAEKRAKLATMRGARP